MSRKITMCLIALLFLSLASYASDSVVVRVTNTYDKPASAITLKFKGAGGSISVDPLTVVSPSGEVPTVPTNPPAISNHVQINWSYSCLLPGQTAMILVTTPNGPLSYQGAELTLHGGSSGKVSSSNIVVTPIAGPFGGPGGAAPLGAFKIVTTYVPCAPPIYTPWVKPGPGQCWWRFCCFPAGFQCYAAIVWCPFQTGWLRFWEFGVWIRVTPFVALGKTGPVYRWQRTTIEPREAHQKQRIKGPHADAPEDNKNVVRNYNRGLEVKYSDDGGVTYRDGSDFTSAFHAFGNALIVDQDDTTEIGGWEETLKVLGPRWETAGAAIEPLIEETQITMEMVGEPDQQAALNQTLNSLQSFKNAVCEIANQLNNASIDNPEPYLQASDALKNLSDVLNGLNLGERFTNAALTLEEMRFGFDTAYDMAQQDLNEIANQDFFLWGLMNRVQPAATHFAEAMSPHLRTQVAFEDYQWCRAIGPGVSYRLVDNDTGEVAGEGTAEVSDSNIFDVPIYREGKNYSLWLKFPTHLSKVVQFFTGDGVSANAGDMIAGDVNNDNCVDPLDLNLVHESMGQGGEEAGHVPAADVNFDGVVDDLDIALVEKNMGQCGQELVNFQSADRALDMRQQ